MRIAALALATALSFATLHAPAQAQATVGAPAPVLQGRDRHGEAIDLKSLRGKVVILTFWASWCGPCRAELAMLDRLARGTDGDRMAIIAVNFREDRAAYARYLRTFEGSPIRFAHDPSGQMSAPYGVRALPHMVLIDHTGQVARVHRGYSEAMQDRFNAEIRGLMRAQEAAAKR